MTAARPLPPSDSEGRFVWLVVWGRLGRSDGRSALVLAYDADDAAEIARRAYPGRLPPEHALLAAPATARAVLDGDHVPTLAHLPVLR